MNRYRFLYNKRRGSINIFFFALLLFFSSFTIALLGLIASTDTKNLNLFANSSKSSDNLSDHNTEKNLINRDNEVSSVKPNKDIIPPKTENQQANDKEPDDSEMEPKDDKVIQNPHPEYAVAAEEIYSFGRSEGKKYVFLTFDDGPNTTITPMVLDTLKSFNVHATFFVLGSSADKNPQVLKQILNDGHAVANHTYSHDYKVLYPNKTVNIEAFMGEIERTNEAIFNAAGTVASSRIVRFPAGSFENWKKHMREELVKSDMYYLDWNAENKDGIKHNVTPIEQLETIAEDIDVAERTNKNVVLLMHDSATKKTTVEALPQIIELFKSKGYEFGTIK
jgi:peptidoglycan/xylan/chitin deacetylase (PgdA/CDA1 family)